MRDASFFLHPQTDWQRRYEALRACFVERQPAHVVAERFGYSQAYVRLLKHQFRHGKLDLTEPAIEHASARRRVTAGTRHQIRGLRQQHRSAAEIAALLATQGVRLSARTVERVLAEEGFPRLPRRSRSSTSRRATGAAHPPPLQLLRADALPRMRAPSRAAGVFLFAPLLARFDLDQIVQGARLPDARTIPARSYLLALLVSKLLGGERAARRADHARDPAIGLFAGLSSLPDREALSSYVRSLNDGHLQRLQQELLSQINHLGLCEDRILGVDFHAVHPGDREETGRQVATRGGYLPVVPCMCLREAASGQMLFTAVDTHERARVDQLGLMVDAWKRVRGGFSPLLCLGTRLMTYAELAELDTRGIRFLLLRRRGQRLVDSAAVASGWTRVRVPSARQESAAPLVYESTIVLRGYPGRMRQVVVRRDENAPPLFLISNDFDFPAEQMVDRLPPWWRRERSLASSVAFFGVEPAFPPTRTGLHFDLVLTAIADTLYSMLARQLRGFETCAHAMLFRRFVVGGGTVDVRDGVVTVTCPRDAQAAALRRVPWQQLPRTLPGIDGVTLQLRFG